MDAIIHSPTGLFHTVTALLALVFGTFILFNQKGTRLHKRIGYGYVLMMLLLNISSFFLSFFGGFSFFHALAIFSLMTVLAGIIPAILRTKHWIFLHYYFMNWSVVGLYCALIAEVGVRFIKGTSAFWWVVFLSMVIPTILGTIIINRKAKTILPT